MQVTYNNLLPLESLNLINIKREHDKKFFKAHKHDFFEIIYITEGFGKHTIDFQPYELVKNTVHIIKPGQVHEWSLDEFHNEYDGYIFLFSSELFSSNRLIDELFLYNAQPFVKLQEPIRKHFDSLVLMLENELKVASTNDLISALFSALLGYLLKAKTKDENVYVQDSRIRQLLELIEEHYMNEKAVYFYAKVLNLTTKRLNELTKKYLDQTVSSLITKRVITEAKRDLIYSDFSIKSISDKLGFNDNSQFSKFFKKSTGLSPLVFRMQKNLTC